MARTGFLENRNLESICQHQGFGYWKVHINHLNFKSFAEQHSINIGAQHLAIYVTISFRFLSDFCLVGLSRSNLPKLNFVQGINKGRRPQCKSWTVSKHPELTFQDATRIRTLRQKSTAFLLLLIDRNWNSLYICGTYMGQNKSCILKWNPKLDSKEYSYVLKGKYINKWWWWLRWGSKQDIRSKQCLHNVKKLHFPYWQSSAVHCLWAKLTLMMLMMMMVMMVTMMVSMIEEMMMVLLIEERTTQWPWRSWTIRGGAQPQQILP